MGIEDFPTSSSRSMCTSLVSHLDARILVFFFSFYISVSCRVADGLLLISFSVFVLRLLPRGWPRKFFGPARPDSRTDGSQGQHPPLPRRWFHAARSRDPRAGLPGGLVRRVRARRVVPVGYFHF